MERVLGRGRQGVSDGFRAWTVGASNVCVWEWNHRRWIAAHATSSIASYGALATLTATAFPAHSLETHFRLIKINLLLARARFNALRASPSLLHPDTVTFHILSTAVSIPSVDLLLFSVRYLW